ncbi:MAG: amidohydrolase family protein [Emcibacteraceae bacterium]|nr:amidohydrolase family protein [Emcibacteraceae bacterium]
MRLIIWALAAITLFSNTVIAAEYKLLKPSFIVDVEKGTRSSGQSILIKDNMIVAISEETEILNGHNIDPNNLNVIDLAGLTVFPGLIDAHSHILLHPYNEAEWNDQVIKETRAERIARGVMHMKATLDAGFTSMRDLGTEGSEYDDVGLKIAMEKGVIVGPRLLVAGRALVVTGSYGPKGLNQLHDITLGAEPADGDNVIKVVRDQIGKGADVIKVYADYFWGPNGTPRPTFNQEELNLMVQTANDSGRNVVAHAVTNEGMRRATLAGVQSIEHGDLGTEDTFKLMKDHGVIYCPTLSVNEANAEYAGWRKGVDENPCDVQIKYDSMKAAIKAGVTICNGSDVGPYTHGTNVRELKKLKEYGLEHLKTLQAATMVGAELMNMKNKLGQLKVGFLADIIAVEGNPLEDLDVLGDVKMVMKNGEVHKR